MSLITGFIYGLLASFIMGAVIGGFFFIMYTVTNKRDNKLFVIYNINGGKYDVEYRRGHVKNHESLGRVYYIPSKKKEGALKYAKYFGSKYEYPTQKNSIRIVPLFCNGQTYVPCEYEHTEKVMKETLEEYEKVIKIKGKEKNVTDYRVADKEVLQPIIKPISTDLISFYMREIDAVAKETQEGSEFWNKWGNFIMFGSTVMACATMFIVTLIFLYQMANNGGSEAPAWVSSIIASASEGQAPPQ